MEQHLNTLFKSSSALFYNHTGNVTSVKQNGKECSLTENHVYQKGRTSMRLNEKKILANDLLQATLT